MPLLKLGRTILQRASAELNPRQLLPVAPVTDPRSGARIRGKASSELQREAERPRELGVLVKLPH